jgi:hypothetical protein
MFLQVTFTLRGCTYFSYVLRSSDGGKLQLKQPSFWIMSIAWYSKNNITFQKLDLLLSSSEKVDRCLQIQLSRHLSTCECKQVQFLKQCVVFRIPDDRQVQKSNSFNTHTWFGSAIWRVIIQSSSTLDHLKAVEQARTNFNSCWSYNHTAQRLFREVAATSNASGCERAHLKVTIYLDISNDFNLYLYSRSLPSSDNRSELKSSGSSNI